MHREVLFYNGFNLLIDIIIGLSVWFFTYRYAWMKGYTNANEDLSNIMEDLFCKEEYYLHQQREQE